MSMTTKPRVGLARSLGAALGACAAILSLLAAPAAQAEPRGIFLCVENASSQSVRIQWEISRGTKDPGGPDLAPGARRCAESTPWLRLTMRPGTEPIGRLMAWGVYARGTDVQVSEGANAGAWVDYRTRANWRQVGVGDTRRVTVSPPHQVPGGDWKFRLQRFPNDENVGGGSDSSGNQWIRYLLTIKKA